MLKEKYERDSGYTVWFNNPNPSKPTEFYYVTYKNGNHEEIPIGSSA